MTDDTTDAASPASASTGRTGAPTWVVATFAGAFGLFYAYAVWNALEFLLEQAAGRLGLSGYGWFVLLLAVVFPIVVFAAALALGIRRRARDLALMLLTGLCLVAVFWLNIVAYASAYGASLLGG